MTVSASVAKQKFGQIIDAARVKPVIIEKSGKEAVVVLSVERFRELQALEDAYWIARAEEGLKSGLVGPEKTAQFLKERMDAE